MKVIYYYYVICLPPYCSLRSVRFSAEVCCNEFLYNPTNIGRRIDECLSCKDLPYPFITLDDEMPVRLSHLSRSANSRLIRILSAMSVLNDSFSSTPGLHLADITRDPQIGNDGTPSVDESQLARLRERIQTNMTYTDIGKICMGRAGIILVSSSLLITQVTISGVLHSMKNVIFYCYQCKKLTTNL